jgi:hypothetical protein
MVWDLIACVVHLCGKWKERISTKYVIKVNIIPTFMSLYGSVLRGNA